MWIVNCKYTNDLRPGNWLNIFKVTNKGCVNFIVGGFKVYGGPRRGLGALLPYTQRLY